MDTIHIPYEYISRIADHCPKALSAYLLAWRYADEALFAIIDLEILQEQNLSSTIFRNSLRSLAREGLLEYVQSKENYYEVSLASYGDEGI